MDFQPYTSAELEFAYCCHVYYRWHTHRRRILSSLGEITKQDLEAEHSEIHVLNLEASQTELALLASLRPTESIASAASKLKGATSKTLRTRMKLDKPSKLLGTGYFASTTGANTSDEIDRYLDCQAEHHGYANRADPPIWLKSWPAEELDDLALQANHSATRISWHLVFAAWNRVETFTPETSEAITAAWEALAAQQRIRFVKVSWVPDHVHLALRSHPSVIPATLVPVLLNSSQDLIGKQYPGLLNSTGNPRMWKPGAYVGTYGNLANTQMQAYLKAWREKNEVARAVT